MRRGLLITLLGVLASVGCGGGSSTSPASVLVSVSPSRGSSLVMGKSLNITAQVTNDTHFRGVAWSLAGGGTLENPTSSSVTYLSPTAPGSDPNVVVIATSVANPAVSAYVPLTLIPVNTFSNVQTVEVNGGPVPGSVVPNAAYTSVTICAPGTTNCQTIDGILVDTGSSGLRILASALASLPSVTDPNNNPVSECVQFPDLAYLWGNVLVADVRISGEVASSLSIQAIAAPNAPSIPASCSGNGTTNAGSQQALGANGILGLGLRGQDCGAACDPGAGGTPPQGAYYTCAGSTCTPAFVPFFQQVSHPGVFFAADNNGVVIQLPQVSGTAPAVSGTLTFGIGTQANNVLADATIFTTDAKGNFTTNLASTGQSLTSSFIDSGVRGFFYPQDSLPRCPGGNSAFFCPAGSIQVTATNIGTNNAQSSLTFEVDNADALLSNPNSAVFSTLAGPSGTGGCASGVGACTFVWGLPFFYGRSVFTPIVGQTPPAGAPLAPWYAYTAGFSKHSVQGESATH